MKHVVPVLIVAFLAAITFVAFLAQHDYGWIIMGLSYMLGGIGLAAALRERKTERQEDRQSERLAILRSLQFVQPPEHPCPSQEDQSDD